MDKVDMSQVIAKMKKLLREDDVPFFTDEELALYLEENDYNVRNTLYQCFCVKAENTTLSISGLSTADSSKYFRRLANMYRPTNTGTLRGF